MEHRELVILGAGPAGLTAAISGKRAGLDVLVVDVRRASPRKVVTAAGDGARAAMSAYHFITAKP